MSLTVVTGTAGSGNRLCSVNSLSRQERTSTLLSICGAQRPMISFLALRMQCPSATRPRAVALDRQPERWSSGVCVSFQDAAARGH